MSLSARLQGLRTPLFVSNQLGGRGKGKQNPSRIGMGHLLFAGAKYYDYKILAHNPTKHSRQPQKRRASDDSDKDQAESSKLRIIVPPAEPRKRKQSKGENPLMPDETEKMTEHSLMFGKVVRAAICNASAQTPKEPTFRPTKNLVEQILAACEREDWAAVVALIKGGVPKTQPPHEILEISDKESNSVLNGRWPAKECLVMAFVTARKGFSISCCPYNPYTLINSLAYTDKYPASMRVGVGNPNVDITDELYLESQVRSCIAQAILVSNKSKSIYKQLPPECAVNAILEAKIPNVLCKMPENFDEGLNLDFIFDNHTSGNLFTGVTDFCASVVGVQRICKVMPTLIRCKTVTDMLTKDHVIYSKLATECGARVDLSDLESVSNQYNFLIATLGQCVEMVAAAKAYSANPGANDTPCKKILGSVGGDSFDTKAIYDGLALEGIDPVFLSTMCGMCGVNCQAVISNKPSKVLPDTKIKTGFAFTMRIMDVLFQFLLGPMGYTNYTTPQAEMELRRKLLTYLHTADFLNRHVTQMNIEAVSKLRVKSVLLSNANTLYSVEPSKFAKFEKFEEAMGVLLNGAAKNTTIYFDTGTSSNQGPDVFAVRMEDLLLARKSGQWGDFALSHLQHAATANPEGKNGLRRVSYRRSDTRADEMVLPSAADCTEIVMAVDKLLPKLVF